MGDEVHNELWEMLQRGASVDSAMAIVTGPLGGLEVPCKPRWFHYPHKAKGVTPLLLAAHANRWDMVTALVDAGANIMALDPLGNNVLHIAVVSNNSKGVSYLIGNGLSSFVGGKGEQLTCLAVRLNYTTLFEELVSVHGLDLLEENASSPGWTAIHVAAQTGNLKAMKFILGTGKVDINLQDRGSRTALHYATARHQLPIVELLIANGCEVNIADCLGEPPLFCLLMAMVNMQWLPRNALETLTKLVEAGADPTIQTGHPTNSPLHVATRMRMGGALEVLKIVLQGLTKSPETKNDISRIRDSEGNSPLHTVFKGNDTNPGHPRFAPQMTAMLLLSGFDPNADNSMRQTPLHKAASVGSADSIRILAEAGANLSRQDQKGDTPLHVALHKQHEESALALISHGADAVSANLLLCTPLHLAAKYMPNAIGALLEQGASTDRRSKDGKQALHLAISSDLVASVEALIANGANINTKDSNNMTPLHHAVHRKSEDILRALLDSGADGSLISPILIGKYPSVFMGEGYL